MHGLGQPFGVRDSLSEARSAKKFCAVREIFQGPLSTMFKKLKELKQKIDQDRAAAVQNAKLKKLRDLLDPPPRRRPAAKCANRRP